jgi:hypothetical protein
MHGAASNEDEEESAPYGNVEERSHGKNLNAKMKKPD